MSPRTTTSALAVTLLSRLAFADEPPPPEGAPETEGEGEEIEIVDRAPPGARAEIGKEELEKDEHDDLHKVLGRTAGVYVRDEDGFGLRPNIGMRGAAADRSAKITIMEDGVLSGPAPYTAPAAYYVPLVTRMSRIEVTKGPSAIRFGPATVGGAIDMRSEPMPGERSAYVDVAGGTYRYGKLHARAAERGERWGLMAEYVRLQTTGFKQLDNNGDTGFDKNDISLTGRVTSPITDEVFHRLDLRVGYGDETSNETYTGLTDLDFAANPQRRYLGSQLDQMTWDRLELRASHRVELDTRTRIDTVGYRHRFQRAWGKVDGFVGQRDLYGLIANPERGANSIYYQVLTGMADTSAPEEELIRGTNDRAFTSQGVQSQLQLERDTGPVAHHVDAGVRIHFDRADRARYEDAYAMIGGQLVRSERPRATVLDSRAETLALAVHAQDKLVWKRLELTAGLRYELLDFRFFDRLTENYVEGTYGVLIPGGGLAVRLTDELSLLAGVHRGFTPAAPSAVADTRPESSVNYEAGARFRNERLTLDAIGFVSNYSNLKGSCTLASGCTEAMEGEQYDGGRVHVFGGELQGASEIPLAKRLVLPLQLAYTFTRTEFQSAFASDFAGWGDVAVGDELPYLPRHQLSATAGVKHPRGQLDVTAQYRSGALDIAGRLDDPEDPRVGSLLTFALTAHANIREWAELYATCSNLLDEQVVISRRPYGARPNPPRMVTVGYKARF